MNPFDAGKPYFALASQTKCLHAGTMKRKLEKSAFDTAVDLLSRRDHASRELARKLGQKGFDGEEIERALRRLEDLNYLNDARFAKAAAKERLHKRRGLRDVRRYLLQKGLDGELVEESLRELARQEDEESLAFEAALRKLSGLREPDAQKRKQKLVRHLISRGFDGELVYRVVTQAEKHHGSDQSRDS